MKTTYFRTLVAAFVLIAGPFTLVARANTAATPPPFARTTVKAVNPILLLPTASPSPNAVLLRSTVPVQMLTVPKGMTGFRQALIGDCDGRADVRAATGGSADACKFRMNHGDVAFYWDAYRDAGCIDSAACTVTGYDIVDFRTKASVAKVSDQGTTATEISHAKLGDCFSIRAARIKEGPESTPHCVLAVRTTTNRFVGPSQIGQFQAVIHDNADSSYCTRRSWDSSWAQEPWGFSTAIHSFTEPAGNTGAGITLTVGQISQGHPGSGPFPCPEYLDQVWRAVLDFDLPAEAKAANASIVFAFTPGGVPSDYSNCFEYLWNPHRWYIHEGPAGQYTSPLMGDINGKVLDHDDNAIGTLTLASGRASYTYGQDQSILGAGHMAVELSMFTDGLNSTDLGNPRLHAGNYPFGNRSTFCGAKDPHIELSYVNVQTTAQPVLPQFEQSIRQTETPHVFVTAAPH